MHCFLDLRIDFRMDFAAKLLAYPEYRFQVGTVRMACMVAWDELHGIACGGEIPKRRDNRVATRSISEETIRF